MTRSAISARYRRMWFQMTSTPDCGIGNGDNADCAGHAIAAVGQLRRGRIRLGRVIDALRKRGASMRRVDVHEVAGLVGVQQRLVPGREVGGVLRCARGIDLVERLFACERIRMMAAGLESGGARLRRRRDPAGPGRNRSRRVGGLLATHRREVRTELRCLLGRDTGHGERARGRRGEEHETEDVLQLGHVLSPHRFRTST